MWVSVSRKDLNALTQNRSKHNDMKRTGHIYERMEDWNLLVQAEQTAVRGKARNKGVKLHEKDWMKNRIEVHNMVINRQMQTADYKHEQKISGQGKLRDIAKLYFHPSHIEHQLLVMAPYEEIDRHLIHHTYASRIGYGQHAAAKQMNEWIQAHHEEFPIYVQFDICKYYDSIPHALIRQELQRIIKDKAFINAMMEPVEKFAPEGKGIPLGIRPSQTFGNLALTSLDRFIKETLRVKYYLRYLDDFVILCRNKGEAHRMIREITAKVESLSFRLHTPKLRPLEAGLDFMGYVTYPGRGMFWRTSDKKAWLRRRKHVTNTRRLREIDGSAWGYVTHGNKHCKRLYKKMNGISFQRMGIKPVQQTDKNGNRIINAQLISMPAVLDRVVTVKDIVPNITTAHGPGRMALLIELYGQEQKLIVNSVPIKAHMEQMQKLGVTMHNTAFVDRGGRHYDIDLERTSILEINHREIGEDAEGNAIYLDNNEPVNL